jgi:NADH-quinone oxidoreductase subunit A
MMAISYFLGERHHEKATGKPYESGVEPTGSTRLHFSIKFYLVALFFVVIDVESIFIFAWAIAFRELGWTGYIGVLIFIFVLFVMLIYLWRTGALDWGTERRIIGKKPGERKL